MAKRIGYLPEDIWSELKLFRVSPEVRDKLMRLPIPVRVLEKLLGQRVRESGVDSVIASLCLKLERGTTDTWDEFGDSYAGYTYGRNLLICADVIRDAEGLYGMPVTQAIEKAATSDCVSYPTARRVYYAMKDEPAVQQMLSLLRSGS